LCSGCKINFVDAGRSLRAEPLVVLLGRWRPLSQAPGGLGNK
jgi:hypothetical protein